MTISFEHGVKMHFTEGCLIHDLFFFCSQVQMLQEQVGHLAESQATTDDRYSKVKQENATLTQK